MKRDTISHFIRWVTLQHAYNTAVCLSTHENYCWSRNTNVLLGWVLMKLDIDICRCMKRRYMEWRRQNWYCQWTHLWAQNLQAFLSDMIVRHEFERACSSHWTSSELFLSFLFLIPSPFQPSIKLSNQALLLIFLV